jgi:hypothetical protein
MTALLSLALAGCPTDDRTLTSGEHADGGADVSQDRSGDACTNEVCGCGDVSSDPKNCGACGHDCTAVPRIGSPGDVKCSASKCLITGSGCLAGYGDCNGDPSDGCETDLGKPEHCGSCTKTCAADAPLCGPAGCASTCPPTAATQCGMSCVDTNADPTHCGDCMTECSQPASGGNATCNQKTCGVACLATFHPCPGTTLCASDTDATHCGAACTACQAPPNGNPVCTAGACSVACNTGYTLCNGACVDVARDVKNCGACGHDCTALSHIGSTTGITCSAGACVVPGAACATGFAHCTVNPDDGCETDITTPARCRSCTTQCTANNPVCTATGCGNSCPATTPTLCNGSCVNLDSDANNCGSCASACPQPASGGSTACEQKVCTLHCLTGFHACGASQCASNATYCSGCTVCQLPPHGNGTQTCAANGSCDVSCNSGYHKCSGDCVSDTDASHCGTNCVMCSAGQRCYQDTCRTPVCSGVVCGGSDGAGGLCTDTNGTCPMGRSCVGSTCTCDIPLTCGGSTVCGSWDFETGTENWTIDPLFSNGSDGTAPVSTTAQHHGAGTHSLSIGTNGNYLDVGITLCGGQTSDMSTLYHASAWLLLVPDGNAPPLDRDADITFHWFFGTTVQDYFETNINTVPIGTWTRIIGNLASPRTDIIRINVELHAVPTVGPWHATFYLDEFRLSALPQ